MKPKNVRLKVNRAKRWAKGHSSDCNPVTNKHRMLAKVESAVLLSVTPQCAQIRLGNPSAYASTLANVPVDERVGLMVSGAHVHTPLCAAIADHK